MSRGLRLGLGLTRRQGGGVFAPSDLFQTGDILLWYDPSDLTTLFQDTAGTTPVTADGQSVALQLDKGQWGGKTLEQVLAAQPELVTNGTFDSDTAWTKGTGWTIGSGVATRDATATASNLSVGSFVEVGKLYQIQWTQSGTGFVAAYLGTASGQLLSNNNTPGTYTRLAVATQTGGVLFRGNTAIESIDNVSVKEIPGYHRTQATGTSMPKYKTGPNPAAAEASSELLTNTGFDSDTVWVKGVVGSPTAATISAGVANLPRTNSTNYAYVSQSFATEIGASYRLVVASVSGSYAARAGTIANATQSLNALGAAGGTTTFVFTATATTTHVTLIPGTDGVTSVIDAASTKLIPASAPYIHWLLYDGTDDSHATSGISWGTDEVAACVGLYKSSDAAQACFAAFGTNGGTAGVSAEQGLILAPGAAAATTYYARFTGSLTPTQAVATGYVAPHTGVVSARGKIATDLQGISVNRGTEALGSGNMGTGNFGSAIPMHFGRRASTSIPFNGREYQTVIRSRLLSAVELSSLETFVAEKTGVIL